MPAPSAGLEQQQVQDRSDTAAAAILRAGRLIWAIGVTLIVITLLGCGVTIWDLHDETIEQQRLAVRNLGFVLAEQTARYVQVVDLVLQEIQSRSATLVASSPEGCHRRSARNRHAISCVTGSRTFRRQTHSSC